MKHFHDLPQILSQNHCVSNWIDLLISISFSSSSSSLYVQLFLFRFFEQNPFVSVFHRLTSSLVQFFALSPSRLCIFLLRVPIESTSISVPCWHDLNISVSIKYTQWTNLLESKTREREKEKVRRKLSFTFFSSKLNTLFRFSGIQHFFAGFLSFYS